MQVIAESPRKHREMNCPIVVVELDWGKAGCSRETPDTCTHIQLQLFGSQMQRVPGADLGGSTVLMTAQLVF